MSAEMLSGRFAILPARALDDKRMSPLLVRRLAVLCCYSNRNGLCWPNRRTLARRMGLSESRVSHVLGELAKLGYLRIMHRYSESNGAQLHNVYQVLYDSELAAEFDTAEESELHGVAGGAAQSAPPRAAQSAPPRAAQSAPLYKRMERTTLNESSERDMRNSIVQTPPERPRAAPKPISCTEWAHSTEGRAYLTRLGVPEKQIGRVSSVVQLFFQQWRKEGGAR